MTKQQWYGVINTDTEEFYPIYSTNRSMLEQIATGMNRKAKYSPHCYTTQKVDIDRIFRVESKQS